MKSNYVIHLIILLNILGVMTDNKRFALYCIVSYASSQWRGKKCLIEHVVNVKT